MSINKSQALALADDFLDDLGSGEPSDLQPRETLSELFLLAGEFVEDAQENLHKSNSIASGKLSESIHTHEPTTSGKVVKVDILMNNYGLFINKGVKGTKRGAGLYSFKTDMPSRKMIDAISKWLKRGKASTRNVRQTISANEAKNKTIGEYQKAFAVARSIKMHGIKKTGFLDKAIISTQKKVRERFEAALKVDILNAITEP